MVDVTNLRPYFVADDGSLPEIGVFFHRPAQAVRAFEELFALGARDSTPGGALVHDRLGGGRDRPFAGPGDASLAANGTLEGFRVLLSGIVSDGVELPSLGVWFDDGSVDLDYRMGPAWGDAEIVALVSLLRRLRKLEGEISITWWGSSGQSAFHEAIENYGGN
jgi:hypothetical protein